MKTCYKCKLQKEISEFNKNQNKCRLCEKRYYKDNNARIAERSKIHRELNKDYERSRNKIYREINKEKITKAKKDYYENNKQAISERRKKHYECNKEQYSEKKKEYSLKNKQKISESGAKYYQLNKERIIQNVSAYRIENKDKLHKKKKEYVKKKLKEDPIFKTGIITRRLICQSFKRGKRVFSKKTKTAQILGCSMAEFKSYIESKFLEGMSFDNHGEWHLDHIIPIATAKTEEDIVRLNHYTNFQPMWASDNLKKGKKIMDISIN